MEILEILDAVECGTEVAEKISSTMIRNLCCGRTVFILKLLGLLFDLFMFGIYFYKLWYDPLCHPSNSYCSDLNQVCEDICDYIINYENYYECLDTCYTECAHCDGVEVIFWGLAFIIVVERIPMIFIIPTMYCMYGDYLDEITEEKGRKMCLKLSFFNLTEFLSKIVDYQKYKSWRSGLKIRFILFLSSGSVVGLSVVVWIWTIIFFGSSNLGLIDKLERILPQISILLALIGSGQQMIVIGKAFGKLCCCLCCILVCLGLSLMCLLMMYLWSSIFGL
eukprot:42200_1